MNWPRLQSIVKVWLIVDVWYLNSLLIVFFVVFTGEQVRRLSDLLTQRGIAVPPVERSFDMRPASGSSGTPSDQLPSPNMLQTPLDKEEVLRPKEGEPRPAASFEALAKEFGVEADLVQALAHRLAGLS